jgi:hypothetical protein
MQLTLPSHIKRALCLVPSSLEQRLLDQNGIQGMYCAVLCVRSGGEIQNIEYCKSI